MLTSSINYPEGLQSPVPLRPHAAKLCIVSYGNAGLGWAGLGWAGLVVAGSRVCVNFPH